MSERAEKEIFESIKKANFKLCNEKLLLLKKQFPNSYYYQVLEIYIKYKQSPKKFDYDLELDSKYGLNSKVYVNDRKALNLLHTLFVEFMKYDEALNIYDKALFKYPSFSLAMEWFEKSIADANYKHMAKASLQLSKYAVLGKNSNLDKRNYHIWYALSIIALFRFKKDTVTEQEQKLLPLLAFKSLTEIKPFQNSEETITFCYVCEELFINLNNDANNEKSQSIIDEIIPTLSKEVNLNLKNFIIRQCLNLENYDLLYTSCRSMMSSINDFSVIKGFIKASKQLGKSNQDTKDTIMEVLGDSRNTRLAYLECDLTFEDRINKNSLEFYLEKHHNKQCCTVDIRSYQAHLDMTQVLEIMSSFEAKNDIHDLNIFTFDEGNLTNITDTCLNLFNAHKESLKTKAKTDYSVLSSFIIKIVEEKLCVKDKKPTLADVLFCLSLLENYQKNDQHNFDTKFWIISLYMYLGCIPKSYSHFADLKIKNVQTDVINHLIYTRLSSLFPSKSHPYIQKFLSDKEHLYEKSLPRLNDFIKISFDRKAYSKILGMIEFRNRLETSSLKWLSDGEQLQLARLSNDKRGSLVDRIVLSLKNMKCVSGSFHLTDNRDWSRFGLIATKEKLPFTSQYLNFTETSIKISLIKELMIHYSILDESNPVLDSLLKDTFQGFEVSAILAENLTPIEKWSFEIFYDLYTTKGTSLMKLLNYQPSKEDLTSWRLSNFYLVKLGTLKTLANTKQIQDKKIKQIVKESLQEIRDNCDDYYRSYSNEITSSLQELKNSNDMQILKSLNYSLVNLESITDCILTIQKTSRNL